MIWVGYLKQTDVFHFIDLNAGQHVSGSIDVRDEKIFTVRAYWKQGSKHRALGVDYENQAAFSFEVGKDQPFDNEVKYDAVFSHVFHK